MRDQPTPEQTPERTARFEKMAEHLSCRVAAERERKRRGAPRNYVCVVLSFENVEDIVALTATLAHLTQERDEARGCPHGNDCACAIGSRHFWLESFTAERKRADEYKTLAKVGTWHADCRPNRAMAARELAKSQAVIDKLADRITELEATLARVTAAVSAALKIATVAQGTVSLDAARQILAGELALRQIRDTLDAALVDPPVSSSTEQTTKNE